MAAPTQAPPATSPASEFIRGIGPLAAISLVVGSMIGSGIFIVSADIGRQVSEWGPGALLLCCDGLWKYRPGAAELAAVALPALALGGPQAAVAALVAAALTAGGADNVTVAVLPVHPPQEEQ